MATPEELLSHFKAAVDEVQKAKKAILGLSRDSEAAIRVLHRMALYLLHEEHDLEGSSAILSKLSACTLACDPRTEAQLSFALQLWATEKYNDSIALLNRIVSETTNASYQALGLDYLSAFMREHHGSKPAIAKIDEQRVAVLQGLVKQESDKKIKAEYQLRLDAAMKEKNAL